jgi:hypothetical protein
MDMDKFNSAGARLFDFLSGLKLEEPLVCALLERAIAVTLANQCPVCFERHLITLNNNLREFHDQHGSKRRACLTH